MIYRPRLQFTVWMTIILVSTTPIRGGSVDQDAVAMAPFQIGAPSLDYRMYACFMRDHKTLRYLRVAGVVKGSVADLAGLKKGDRIVAFESCRIEGEALSAILNKKFPRTNGTDSFTFTVRRPPEMHEFDIILRYPKKNGEQETK